MIDLAVLSANIEDSINKGVLFNNAQNPENAKERFICGSAHRLIEAYALYKGNRKYCDDFLLSLRNYLIVTESSLFIENINASKFEDYGLYFEDGRVSCFKTFPKYIDLDFVQESFLYDYKETTKSKKESNLSTDTFIKSLTGYTEFKSESQKLSVYGALNTPGGYTTLISIPTGGGKSLVTQTMAYQNEGLTIVIVPTISLSMDQMRVSKDAIKRNSVDDEIFSYSSGANPVPIIKAINGHTARLLFISPETLVMNSAFRDAIEKANSQKYLKNIIIDEAHIVTDWGALFRVDYQCLESWRKNLMITNPSIRTILLSATFEETSVSTLKELFSNDEKWIEIRCDSLRREPRYMFVKANGYMDKRNKIVEMVKLLPHPIIVYVAAPDDAEEIKDLLKDHGICNVKTYTGKTSNAKRKELIDQWVDNKFDIMIATSAFGVGVNKNDIRTVLHAYIPQNANAYYQELGRGGRDGLPCLSVMCIDPTTDENSAFQKITKRVMTTDKVCKRWLAMYNNPKSVRKNDYVIVDTSISPEYLSETDDESLESGVVSEANMNWNIYVLLFLRRNGLISIRSVGIDKEIYKFHIENISPFLKITEYEGSEAERVISEFREAEYNQHIGGFNILKRSIRDNRKRCWSEMFYDTYSYVNEYCGGCASHKHMNLSQSEGFPLKTKINEPTNLVSTEMESFLNGSKDVVIEVADRTDLKHSLSHLISKDVNVIVAEESLFDLVNNDVKPDVALIINRHDLRELMAKDNEFYISGSMIVCYPEDDAELQKYMSLFIGNRQKLKKSSIVHLMPHELYCESVGKKYTDMIDGPVFRSETLFR